MRVIEVRLMLPMALPVKPSLVKMNSVTVVLIKNDNTDLLTRHCCASDNVLD